MTAAYRRLWAATAVSNLADGLLIAALPLLAASLTRDARLVALIATLQAAPLLLVSLGAGLLVDRGDRRRVMVATTLCRGALIGGLGLLQVMGDLRIWWLLVAAFGYGCLEVLFDSGTHAVMPGYVGTEDLERANSRLWMAEVGANYMVGPALGGLAFAVAPGVPLAITTCLFILAAPLVRLLPSSAPGPVVAGVRSSVRADLSVAWRWLRHRPALLGLSAMTALAALADSAAHGVLVLFALQVVGVDERGFGLLTAAGLGAAVIGTTMAGPLRRHVGVTRALALAALLLGAGLAVVATSSAPLVAAAGLAVQGAGFGLWQVVNVSLRQRLVPNHLLGRVSGLLRTFGAGAQPLGALLGGWVAAAFGLRVAVGFGAPMLLVVAVVLLAAGRSSRLTAMSSRAAEP